MNSPNPSNVTSARSPRAASDYKVLMCAPTHYGLAYEINPWMSRSIQPDLNLAGAQWQELYRVITADVGCTVELIEQVAGSPDMVFTANAGLVSGSKVLLSHFRHNERQGEERPFKEWFKAHGFEVIVPPSHFSFEGEGDALFVGEAILAGYLKRSDIASHRWIAETISREVVSLELADNRWYHLDTCLFVLDATSVVIYPGAFDRYALQVLRENYEVIEVNEQEALRFACNSVVIDKSVVLPSGCPQLSHRLQDLGYAVHSVEMSEFLKAGGASKCLCLFTNSNP